VGNGTALAVKKASAKKADAAPAEIERRDTGDRRQGEDRRKRNEPVAVERRSLDRREKVNRRRQIDPTTCERDYTPDEVEFMAALDEYKRRNGRMFPTCSEVLEVIRGLGYEKRAGAAPQVAIEIPSTSVEAELPQASFASPTPQE
jgi:hypothetical protein